MIELLRNQVLLRNLSVAGETMCENFNPNRQQAERIWLVEDRAAAPMPIRNGNIIGKLLLLSIILVTSLISIKYDVVWPMYFTFVGMAIGVIWWRTRTMHYLLKDHLDLTCVTALPFDARLLVSGRRRDIGPMSALTDTSFEPVFTTRLYSPLLRYKLGNWAYWLSMIAMPISVYWLDGGTMFAYVLIPLIAVDCLAWLIQRLWPTYYRIVPGKLDVLKFFMLGKRATLLKQFDLRQSKIAVALRHRKATISNGNESEVFDLSTISEPHRFVQGLFQAAICTTPAPPLPDDELLG